MGLAPLRKALLRKVSDFEDAKNGLLTVANHEIPFINRPTVKDLTRENQTKKSKQKYFTYF